MHRCCNDKSRGVGATIGQMKLVFTCFLQAAEVGNLAAFAGKGIRAWDAELASKYRISFGQIEDKKVGIGSAGGNYGYFGGGGVKADLVEVDGLSLGLAEQRAQ